MLKYKFLGMIFILILSKLNAQVNYKGNQDKGIVLKPIFQNCLYMDNFKGIKPDTINLDKIANESSFNKNELLTIVFTKSEIIVTDDSIQTTNSILGSINKYDNDKLKDFIINIKEYKPKDRHLSAFCEFTLKYNGKVRIEQTVPNWLCFFINPNNKIIINEDSVKLCIKKHFKSYQDGIFPLVKIGNEKIIIKIINEVLEYSVRAVNKYDKDRKDIITKIKELQNSSKQTIYKNNILEEASLQVLNKYNDTVKFKTKEFRDKEEKRIQNEKIEKDKKDKSEKEKKDKIEKEKEDFKYKNIKYKNSSLKLIDSIISKYSDVNEKKDLDTIKKIIESINPTDTNNIINQIYKCIRLFSDYKSIINEKPKEEKIIYEGKFERLIEILNDRLDVLKKTTFKGVSINLNFLQSYFNYNFNNNLLAEKTMTENINLTKEVKYNNFIDENFIYKNQQINKKNKNNKIFQSGNENFILNHFYVSAIAKLNPTKLFKLKKPIENLSVGAGIGIGFINYKSSVIKSIDTLNITKNYLPRYTGDTAKSKSIISEIYRIDSSRNSYIEEHIFTNSLIYLNLIDLSVQYKIPIKKNKFSIQDVQFNLGFSAGVPISFTSTYYAYYKKNEINPLPNINTNPTLKAGLITNFYLNPILNFKIKNQLIGLGLLISLGSVGLNNESSDAIEKTGIENSLNSFSIKNFGFNIVYHFSKK